MKEVFLLGRHSGQRSRCVLVQAMRDCLQFQTSIGSEASEGRWAVGRRALAAALDVVWTRPNSNDRALRVQYRHRGLGLGSGLTVFLTIFFRPDERTERTALSSRSQPSKISWHVLRTQRVSTARSEERTAHM